MNLSEVEELLEKYNIQTLEELEYYLDIDNASDECMDDPDEDKNCINAKCYEDIFVPECRKIIEIYNKYFKNDIKSKKLFIQHLVDSTSKSHSSIENYLSCKSCNQQIAKSINNSLKISDSNFKKDFCFNLEKKFNYVSLFDTDYVSIKQFLIKDHQITRDNFAPTFGKKEVTMTKVEEEKLFDLTHVSKEKLKSNLEDSNNLDGSNSYKMNLALAAFNRNLMEESYKIIEILSHEKEFHINQEFLQLKAKVLSSMNRDKDAIVILNELIESAKPNIDIETNNLLAASIKRDAFNEYIGDDEELAKRLSLAKDIYFSVYKLNNDYYPALNYMYLRTMLSYIHNNNQENIQKMRNEFSEIWSGINLRINDWWSYISNVEYLILLGRYQEAISELDAHFSTIEDFEISDFNIASTVRQLELYSKFCDDSEINDIITLLKGYLTDNE